MELVFTRVLPDHAAVAEWAMHVADLIDQLEQIGGVEVNSSVTVDGVTITFPRLIA